MKLIRGLWRFFRLLYPLGWGLVHGNAKHLRALKSTPPDPEAQQKNQEWYRRVLACLNIRVSVTGQPAEAPCLVVCNHISWLDILVLGSAVPVAFLSKAEVAQWPLISRLSRAGGTLFIQRGGEGAARRSIEGIRKAFKRQQSVAVFPEGTTGKGHTVLPFHPRLFAAAIESGVQCTADCVALSTSGGCASQGALCGSANIGRQHFGNSRMLIHPGGSAHRPDNQPGRPGPPASGGPGTGIRGWGRRRKPRQFRIRK